MFSVEKGFASALTVILLVVGIGVGTYLVQQRTNFLPKAGDLLQFGSGDIANGLVGYWDFNTLKNSGATLFVPNLANPNATTTATLRGATSISSKGKQLGAGRLATNGYFDIPMDSNLNLRDDFTLALWVKLDKKDGGYFNILGTSRRGNYGGSLITLGTRSNSSVLAVSLSFDTVDIPYNLPQNEWVHLAARFTKSSKQSELYVNGQKIGSGTHKNTPNLVAESSWRIGKVDYGIENVTLNGMVDDVRIYNRKLTDGEINQLVYGY